MEKGSQDRGKQASKWGGGGQDGRGRRAHAGEGGGELAWGEWRSHTGGGPDDRSRRDVDVECWLGEKANFKQAVLMFMLKKVVGNVATRDIGGSVDALVDVVAGTMVEGLTRSE